MITEADEPRDEPEFLLQTILQKSAAKDFFDLRDDVSLRDNLHDLHEIALQNARHAEKSLYQSKRCSENIFYQATGHLIEKGCPAQTLLRWVAGQQLPSTDADADDDSNNYDVRGVREKFFLDNYQNMIRKHGKDAVAMENAMFIPVAIVKILFLAAVGSICPLAQRQARMHAEVHNQQIVFDTKKKLASLGITPM